MPIRTRFNIALIIIFSLGFALSVFVTYRVVLNNAKEEVLRNAGLMMETALAVRGYTIDEIKPHLDPMMEETFLPQSVPAYSAVETFMRLQKKYPDFSYREATLNPTNPRDRTTDWEAAIVHQFKTTETPEIVGERAANNGGGTLLYMARPIRISKAACLTCHSVPEAAPTSLRTKYGDTNGFGWKLNEVVGIQIVTAPTDLAEKNAWHAFWAFAAVLAGVFVLLFIIINYMLTRLVIQPLREIAAVSDEISQGNLDLPEFKEEGAKEIRNLQTSFNRMRRSIEKAMKVVHLQKQLINKSTPN